MPVVEDLVVAASEIVEAVEVLQATLAGSAFCHHTGNNRRGATSPCITTPTGSVQFTSDASVVAQGFTVDAVVPC